MYTISQSDTRQRSKLNSSWQHLTIFYITYVEQFYKNLFITSKHIPQACSRKRLIYFNFVPKIWVDPKVGPLSLLSCRDVKYGRIESADDYILPATHHLTERFIGFRRSVSVGFCCLLERRDAFVVGCVSACEFLLVQFAIVEFQLMFRVRRWRMKTQQTNRPYIETTWTFLSAVNVYGTSRCSYRCCLYGVVRCRQCLRSACVRTVQTCSILTVHTQWCSVDHREVQSGTARPWARPLRNHRANRKEWSHRKWIWCGTGVGRRVMTDAMVAVTSRTVQ